MRCYEKALLSLQSVVYEYFPMSGVILLNAVSARRICGPKIFALSSENPIDNVRSDRSPSTEDS